PGGRHSRRWSLLWTTMTTVPKLLKLVPGDTVRLVSPASTPTKDGVVRGTMLLESLGLRVELGRHVFDRLGYLAGLDADRLADINDALNDRSEEHTSELQSLAYLVCR